MTGKSNRVTLFFLKLVAFSIPFQVFALPVSGKGIEIGHLFFALAVVFLLRDFLLKCGHAPGLDTPERYLLLFCTGAVISFVIGFHLFQFQGHEIKGIKQLIGLFEAISVFFVIHRSVNTPDEFCGLVRFLFCGMGCLAFFGLWQFLAMNFTGIRFLADWSWAQGLNPSLGDGWRRCGEMGGLYRAHSFAPEPAQYAMMLTSIIGLAVVRILPHKNLQRSGWKTLLPSFPACMGIILAYILSFSLLAIVSLMVIIAAYVSLFFEKKPSIITGAVLVILMLLGVFTAMDTATEGKIAQKMTTIKMIMPTGDKDVTSDALSALALASNLEVGLKALKANPFTGWGIGGHPFAFAKHAPVWTAKYPILLKLCKEDAGSLGIRLISETGMVGLSVFLLFIWVIIRHALRAIQEAEKKASASALVPLCTGLLISTIGVIIRVLFRYGSYYSLVFWVSLGLTSTIPHVLGSCPQAPDAPHGVITKRFSKGYGTS